MLLLVCGDHFDRNQLKRLLGLGEPTDAITKDTEAGLPPLTLNKICDPFDLPKDDDTSAKAVAERIKSKLGSDDSIIAEDDEATKLDSEVSVTM
jgi:response regulator of citrate/malate metabolism